MEEETDCGEVVSIHEDRPDHSRIPASYLEGGLSAQADAHQHESLEASRGRQEIYPLLRLSHSASCERQIVLSCFAITDAGVVESENDTSPRRQGPRQLDVDPIGPHAMKQPGVHNDDAEAIVSSSRGIRIRNDAYEGLCVSEKQCLLIHEADPQSHDVTKLTVAWGTMACSKSCSLIQTLEPGMCW